MHGIEQFKIANCKVIKSYKALSINTFYTDYMPYMCMLCTLKILQYGTCRHETFLKHFLKMSLPPTPRKSDHGMIDPYDKDFSAFVFKIQANMNKAHRDRIAFMRITSGKYNAGMEAWHVQGGRKIKLSKSTEMMADERHIVEEAYSGDIIGVFDPGIFSIGDTITTLPDKFRFGGMPTFAPEHFASLRLVDSMKRKQFVKGVTQIAQEGAIQLFKEFSGGLGEVVVGAVGVLQFDVLKYRLESEYGVEIRLDPLPYEHIRWIENKEEDMDLYASRLNLTSDCKRVKDMHDKPLLVFIHEWSVKTVLDRNEGLILSEFGRN
jgi:peptide chain release factor 3